MGLYIRFLGRFALWRDGVLLPPEAWRSEKTKLLLKLLASQRGRVFAQDELIEQLWGETGCDASRAAVNLRGRVSELRYLLQPSLTKGHESRYIETTRQGYCFVRNRHCVVDLEELSRHAERARQLERADDLPAAAAAYHQAISLYTDDFLADDRYEDWTISHRELWQQVYLDALTRLACCQTRLKRHREAIDTCRQILQKDPLHEQAYRDLMLNQYLLGNRAEAIRTYQLCADVLARELRAETSAATRQVYQIICTEQEDSAHAEAAAITAPHAAAPPCLAQMPFVGREAELRQLANCLETARRGGGQLAFVDGEAGVGKTRIIQEFAKQHGRRRGMLILQGACYNLATPLAYGPLLDAVKTGCPKERAAVLLADRRDLLAELANAIAEWRELAPALAPAPRESPDLQTDFLHESLAYLLIALAREQTAKPLLVFLDDLQWADASTADFLRYFRRHIEHEPILVLGALRAAELGRQSGIESMIVQIQTGNRNTPLQWLELRPLFRPAVAQLLHELGCRFVEEDGLVDRVWQETHGLPLCILYFLQFLIEQDVLYPDGQGALRPRPKRLQQMTTSTPQRIKQLVIDRVSRLALEERQLLEMLAVFGTDLDPASLSQLVGHDLDEVHDHLERLIHARLVVEPPSNGRYALSHAKIGEIVCEIIDLDAKRRMHRTIAERFADETDLSGEQLAFIAHHFLQAQAWRKAIHFLIAAAERYQELHANRDAATMLQQALDLSERLRAPGGGGDSHADEIKILQQLDDLCDVLGDRVVQAQCVNTLKARAQQGNDRRLLCEALQRESWLKLLTGNHTCAKERATKALELSEALRDAGLICRALERLGSSCWHLGEFASALGYYERACAANAQAEDRKHEAYCLEMMALCHRSQGHYGQVLPYLERAYITAQAGNDLRGQGIAFNTRADTYLRWGDCETALAYYDRALRLHTQIGNRRGQCIASMGFSGTHMLMGNHEKAEAYLNQTLDISREIHDRRLEAMITIARGVLASARGEPAAAISHCREAIRICEAIGQHSYRAHAHSCIAMAALSQTDHDEALRCSKIAVQLCEAGYVPADAQPQTIYFHHFQVLSQRDRDGSQPLGYLRRAHEEVMKQCEQLPTEHLKRCFLKAAPSNPDILKNWERIHGTRWRNRKAASSARR